MHSVVRGLVGLLAGVVVLAGCSPSADEVTDTLAGLPGVISAEPSCFEFTCTVQIEAEPTSSAAELADMLAAARTVDHAAEVEVSMTRDPLGAFTAELRMEAAPATEDAAVGALLAWAAGQEDIATFIVERSTPEAARVGGSVADGTSIWPIARDAWPLASELTGAALDLTRPEHLQQQSLRVEGTFPDGPVEVAEELQATSDGSGLTGVVLTPDRLVLGAITRHAADALRRRTADDPRLDSVTTEVVVTTNVLLSSSAREPGTSQRLDPVLAALDGQPGVQLVTLEGGTVETQADDVRSFPRLVERVRRRAGAAFVDTTLVLVDRTAQYQAEITPGGDDAVLDLVLGLLPTPGLRSVEVRQELEPDPDGPAVRLAVEVRQPGPGTGEAPPVGPEVTRLAELLATTPGSAASYFLGVTIEDADGRSADAGWRVDRTADGFVLGEISGTDERQAEVRAAWARGLA